MKNITYLFGAGASMQALPLVKTFPTRMEQMLSFLKTSAFNLSDKEKIPNQSFNHTPKELQNEFLDDLNELIDASGNHASVDTYAKKLFIKNDKEKLKQLKLILSAYLVLEQTRNPADTRYDAFFASILNKHKRDFPKNIRILSWNYDFQFEKAYSIYSENESLDSNQKMLRVVGKNTLDSEIENDFSIYKINGTTNIFSDRGHFQKCFIPELHSNFDATFFEKLLINYKLIKTNPNIHSSLSFAWETSEHTDKTIIEKCIAGTKETNVLIVIGYSFPFFNRDTDRKIINSMEKLQMVYFQAPDADIIKERFLSIRDNLNNDQLITRFDTEMFLLPKEL